jgi:hypothetical protein
VCPHSAHAGCQGTRGGACGDPGLSQAIDTPPGSLPCSPCSLTFGWLRKLTAFVTWSSLMPGSAETLSTGKPGADGTSPGAAAAEASPLPAASEAICCQAVGRCCATVCMCMSLCSYSVPCGPTSSDQHLHIRTHCSAQAKRYVTHVTKGLSGFRSQQEISSRKRVCACVGTNCTDRPNPAPPR